LLPRLISGFGLTLDAVNHLEIIQHVGVLIVDPSHDWEMIPLETIALEVEPQGLMYPSNDWLTVVVSLRLGL